jgi:hypothetical protein
MGFVATSSAGGPPPDTIIWVLVTLRAAWWLPDWLGKWQRLIDRGAPDDRLPVDQPRVPGCVRLPPRLRRTR